MHDQYNAGSNAIVNGKRVIQLIAECVVGIEASSSLQSTGHRGTIG